MADANQKTGTDERAVICIGDLHGHIEKAEKLWWNLEASMGKEEFNNALVIFLGDYCDRGPNTKKVLDFLIDLPSKYQNQKHVFLAGNHDLAFSAFLGILPEPGNGVFKEGWREYEQSEEIEGWYKGDGYESMYLQGRRWGGIIKDSFNVAKGTECQDSIYDAGPTFESYGVPHGSSDLRQVIPDAHKKFLSNLVWIHEEDNVCIETEEGLRNCKLIAVHAGLETEKDVEEQICSLKAKDLRVPKINALSGRNNVWDMPKKLTEKPTIVVSGHHGKLHIDGLRLIIDEGGGLLTNPITAIVLPSKKLVRDTD